MNRQTDEFYWVFASLAAMAALAMLFALMLPRRRPLTLVAPAVADQR